VKDFSVEEKKYKELTEPNAEILHNDMDFELLVQVFNLVKRICDMLPEMIFPYYLGWEYFQSNLPGADPDRVMSMGDFRTMLE